MERFEEKIKQLESAFARFHNRSGLPGTIISRVLNPEEGSGVGWSLSLGFLMEPKVHIYGRTLDECFANAMSAMKKNLPGSSVVVDKQP